MAKPGGSTRTCVLGAPCPLWTTKVVGVAVILAIRVRTVDVRIPWDEDAIPTIYPIERRRRGRCIFVSATAIESYLVVLWEAETPWDEVIELSAIRVEPKQTYPHGYSL